MTEVKLPKISLSQVSSTIAEIYVNIGDVVSKDDELMSFETDKLTNVIEAPCSGTIVDILVEEGDEVKVDDTVLLME